MTRSLALASLLLAALAAPAHAQASDDAIGPLRVFTFGDETTDCRELNMVPMNGRPAFYDCPSPGSPPWLLEPGSQPGAYRLVYAPRGLALASEDGAPAFRDAPAGDPVAEWWLTPLADRAFWLRNVATGGHLYSSASSVGADGSIERLADASGAPDGALLFHFRGTDDEALRPYTLPAVADDAAAPAPVREAQDALRARAAEFLRRHPEARWLAMFWANEEERDETNAAAIAAAEQRREEVRRAEEARASEEARREREATRAAAVRDLEARARAEQARQAEAERREQEARRAEAERREAERRAAQARQEEAARRAEEAARRAEEARRDQARQAEAARRAADLRAVFDEVRGREGCWVAATPDPVGTFSAYLRVTDDRLRLYRIDPVGDDGWRVGDRVDYAFDARSSEFVHTSAGGERRILLTSSGAVYGALPWVGPDRDPENLRFHPVPIPEWVQRRVVDRIQPFRCTAGADCPATLIYERVLTAEACPAVRDEVYAIDP